MAVLPRMRATPIAKTVGLASSHHEAAPLILNNVRHEPACSKAMGCGMQLPARSTVWENLDYIMRREPAHGEKTLLLAVLVHKWHPIFLPKVEVEVTAQCGPLSSIS